MHCAVIDNSGASGEFSLAGQAHPVDDPPLRALAVRLFSYIPAEHYVLFEFELESAVTITYPEGGPPVHCAWRRAL